MPFNAAERIRRLPLELGKIPSVFERRELERRPNQARTAGPDTLVIKVAAEKLGVQAQTELHRLESPQA